VPDTGTIIEVLTDADPEVFCPDLWRSRLITVKLLDKDHDPSKFLANLKFNFFIAETCSTKFVHEANSHITYNRYYLIT
jgi:hypothetical protein